MSSSLIRQGKSQIILSSTLFPARYFTLTHKAIEIKNDSISNTTRRKLSAYARLDTDTNSFTVSAFLLAQIGKNYSVDIEKRITGDELIRYADDVMADIQRCIGGGIIYLDCEDKQQLKTFYTTRFTLSLYLLYNFMVSLLINL